jgi:hypothetical protein
MPAEPPSSGSGQSDCRRLQLRACTSRPGGQVATKSVLGVKGTPTATLRVGNPAHRLSASATAPRQPSNTAASTLMVLRSFMARQAAVHLCQACQQAASC